MNSSFLGSSLFFGNYSFFGNSFMLAIKNALVASLVLVCITSLAVANSALASSPESTSQNASLQESSLQESHVQKTDLQKNSAQEINFNLVSSWLNATFAHGFKNMQLVHQQELVHLYQLSEFTNFWLDKQGRLNAAGQQLLADLQPWLALEKHPRLEAYRQLADLLSFPLNTHLPRQRQATDILISDLFLTYFDDLKTGYWAEFDVDQDQDITNAYENWDHWPQQLVRSSLAAELPKMLFGLQGQEPENWALTQVLSLQPNQQFYQPLRQAFADLEQVEKLGDWPQITEELQLHSAAPEVTRLALQLERLGFLKDFSAYLPSSNLPASNLPSSHESSAAQEPSLDAALAEALKKFQRQHSLNPTGRTDAATRAWLNLTPSQRMRLLAHNLRRLHHLPQQLHARHLMVNLAGQDLSYIENQQRQLSMKVVTGTSQMRTPIMNQWLTSLVLNPLWNVPNNIARRSIFPKALQNPDYFHQRDYALVEGWSTPARFVSLSEVPKNAFEEERPDYRIVQKSGSYNQLGKVKFRLSNQQAIYLHDTPYRHVFQQAERALSSGCVRVENSDLLVETLLSSAKGWDKEKLAEVYASNEELYVRVQPRVAVYLMYWTVWPDEDGQMRWYADSYNKDNLEESWQKYADNSEAQSPDNQARN